MNSTRRNQQIMTSSFVVTRVCEVAGTSAKQRWPIRRRGRAMSETENVVESCAKPMFYKGRWAQAAENVVLEWHVIATQIEVGVQTDMSLDPDEIVVTQRELLEGTSEIDDGSSSCDSYSEPDCELHESSDEGGCEALRALQQPQDARAFPAWNDNSLLPTPSTSRSRTRPVIATITT